MPAEAARLTSQYELANDSYREAVKLQPQMTRAGIAWSYLFLQKYAAPLAEQNEPAEATQVQVTPLSSGGKVSLTVAPTTSFGPLLATVMV